MSEKCDAVLLTRTFETITEVTQNDFSWVHLVTEENYSSVKKSAKAHYAGYGLFDGNYNDFRKQLTTRSSYGAFSDRTRFARSHVVSGTSDAAIEAWRQCELAVGGSAKLFVYLRNVRADSASLNIEWNPFEDTVGPLQDAYLSLQNCRVVGRDTFSGKSFTGKAVLQLEFLPGKAIRATAGGQLKAGSKIAEDTIFVPALYEFEQHFGDVTTGTFSIRPNPYRDREIAVYCAALANREDPRDEAWMDLTVSSIAPDGTLSQMFHQRKPTLIFASKNEEDGDGSPKFDIVETKQTLFVPKGAASALELSTHNHFTKAHDLFVHAIEVDSSLKVLIEASENL